MNALPGATRATNICVRDLGGLEEPLLFVRRRGVREVYDMSARLVAVML